MIIEHFDLQSCHTMACISSAEQAVLIHQRSDLVTALNWAAGRGVPVQVLGEGSNVLASQRVQGLTLLNRMQGVRCVTWDEATVTLDVAGGTSWHWWVCFSSQQGWHGLENLALIPGTVGAAPVQNVGAYGVETGDFIESVTATHLQSGEQRVFAHEECDFGYRQSAFKQALAGQWFIESVRFVLSRRFAPVLSYRPLDGLHEPTPAQLIQAVVSVRQSKLPDPNVIPNAGSFFTNPIVSREKADALRTQWPDLPMFVLDNGSTERYAKVAAAWLIEQCGWRGQTDPETGVGCYAHQALVVVNPQQRSRSDVLAWAEAIRQDVAATFGLTLQREPQLFGQDSDDD